MALENQIEVTVERDTAERVLRPLSDKEWEVLASELESALDELVLPTLQTIYANLDYLLEQDSKFDEEAI